MRLLSEIGILKRIMEMLSLSDQITSCYSAFLYPEPIVLGSYGGVARIYIEKDIYMRCSHDNG